MTRQIASRRGAAPKRAGAGIVWSEIAAVMGAGVLAVIGMAMAVQELFGPGLGVRWNLTPVQAVEMAPLLIIALGLGMALGTIVWAAAARFFLPPAIIRRELTQPGVPIASWYGKIVADWILGIAD